MLPERRRRDFGCEMRPDVKRVGRTFSYTCRSRSRRMHELVPSWSVEPSNAAAYPLTSHLKAELAKDSSQRHPFALPQQPKTNTKASPYKKYLVVVQCTEEQNGVVCFLPRSNLEQLRTGKQRSTEGPPGARAPHVRPPPGALHSHAAGPRAGALVRTRRGLTDGWTSHQPAPTPPHMGATTILAHRSHSRDMACRQTAHRLVGPSTRKPHLSVNGALRINPPSGSQLAPTGGGQRGEILLLPGGSLGTG